MANRQQHPGKIKGNRHVAPAVWHVARLARWGNINKREGEGKTMIETEKRRKCIGKIYTSRERGQGKRRSENNAFI